MPGRFNQYSDWPQETREDRFPAEARLSSYPPRPVEFSYRTDMGVMQPEGEMGHPTELMQRLKMSATSLPVFIGPRLHVVILKTQRHLSFNPLNHLKYIFRE
jgi:hypothetical protein